MTIQNSMKWTAWAGTAVIMVLLIWLYTNGFMADPGKLQALLESAGGTAPFVFILIQVIQVIIPIIPGGLSCALGVLAFGPVNGFVYNYLGLVLGSICAFLLARNCGKPLIQKLVSQNIWEKYSPCLNTGKKFDAIFALAIFLPMAPDDALCMLAGLTSMKTSRFV